MEYQTLLLATLVLMLSSTTVGLYLVTDYFMDPSFPELFGQACGDTIQDECLWINSHLNTFGLADYGTNKDCVVTLDAGAKHGALYKVLWKRFKIESGDCSSDYLELYDANSDNINSSVNLIGRFCGRSYPNITGYPTQRYLTLKWHTDGTREDKGFRMMATRNLPYPCVDDYYHCKAENKCMDGRLRCDGIEQCDDGEDESSCSTWEKLIGGFLALGTAGIVGVVGAIMFACILIGVTICSFTCCKNPCRKCWGRVCKTCVKQEKDEAKGELKKKTLADSTSNTKGFAGGNRELAIGSKELADGSKALPGENKQLADESKKLADKSKEPVNGSKALPDKSKESVNGSKALSDKSKESVNGSKTLPDKSKTLPDESKKLADKSKDKSPLTQVKAIHVSPVPKSHDHNTPDAEETATTTAPSPDAKHLPPVIQPNAKKGVEITKIDN